MRSSCLFMCVCFSSQCIPLFGSPSHSGLTRLGTTGMYAAIKEWCICFSLAFWETCLSQVKKPCVSAGFFSCMCQKSKKGQYECSDIFTGHTEALNVFLINEQFDWCLQFPIDVWPCAGLASAWVQWGDCKTAYTDLVLLLYLEEDFFSSSLVVKRFVYLGT